MTQTQHDAAVKRIRDGGGRGHRRRRLSRHGSIRAGGCPRRAVAAGRRATPIADGASTAPRCFHEVHQTRDRGGARG